MTDQQKAFYSALNCSEAIHTELKRNPNLLKKAALVAVKENLLNKYKRNDVIYCGIDSSFNELELRVESLRMTILVQIVFDEDHLPFWQIKITNHLGKGEYISKPYQLFEESFGIAFTYTMIKPQYKPKFSK